MTEKLISCLWQQVQWWSHARTRNQYITVSVQSSSQMVGALSWIPFCWVPVGNPVGPGKDTHGTLGPYQQESRGWPESQFNTAVQCRNTQNMEAERWQQEHWWQESVVLWRTQKRVCCSVVCSSNEDEIRLRIRRDQLMWKSSCLNVRVGERDDKSVMHRQRQGTLPKYDHHLCSDSVGWKKSNNRHSCSARLAELNTRDETFHRDDHHVHFDLYGWTNWLERNVICILCITREMCRIECRHLGNDLVSTVLRTMTTTRRGSFYLTRSGSEEYRWDGYSEKLFSSLKAHSTSTSGKSEFKIARASVQKSGRKWTRLLILTTSELVHFLVHMANKPNNL